MKLNDCHFILKTKYDMNLDVNIIITTIFIVIIIIIIILLLLLFLKCSISFFFKYNKFCFLKYNSEGV